MTKHQTLSKPLNIATWICQILLSLTLLWAAGMKLFQPIDQLAQQWPWTADNPILTRVAGIIDLLGGLGLVLPMALRIKPMLTLYAAYGTIALMVAASVFHISRGEASLIGFNIFVAFVAGFIAWARSK
ncbi:DoxX family protein [Emticicia soli]|uniref:DoxX family protein n=1 Tax=Emticicia soli TaxID=2027878 RepID=A0ABW5J6X4_9BACT